MANYRSRRNFYPPPRIVCFICGSEVPADYPIYLDPQNGHPNSPHFPFLLAHQPPMGCLPLEHVGAEAKSCRICYTTLMRQWEEFERSRVSPTKRTYWIRRNDGIPFVSHDQQLQAAIQLHSRLRSAVVSTPSSNHSVMMAAPLPPVPSSTPTEVVSSVDRTKVNSVPVAHSLCFLGREGRRAPSQTVAVSSATPGEDAVPSSSAGGDNDSALDLSSGSRERETMKSRSSVASHVSVVSHQSYQSEGACSSTDILDLTLPDKNASYEVCYVCGEEFKKGMLSFSFAKMMNKEPFYPSLMCHSRPPRSRPMDSSGRVQTCDECHNHLLQQWFQFESDDVPHADRNYSLRKRPTPQGDNTTFVCYLCALDYHSTSLKLLYARPNPEQDPYYPFIEQQKPPPRASPISPQGMVQVCTLCYKTTKEKHHGFVKADQPPPKKRKYETTESSPSQEEEDRNLMPADVTCILCRRKFSVGTFKFLHTRGPPHGGLPFFPFLSDLTRPEDGLEVEEDKQGRVRACQACTTSLMNQWTAFQRESTPIDERQYTYPSLVTGPRSVSSVRAQSPASIKSGGTGTITPGKSNLIPDTFGSATGNNHQQQQQPRTRSNTLESRPRSSSNPHSPNPPPPIPSPASSTNQRSTPNIPASSTAASSIVTSTNPAPISSSTGTEATGPTSVSTTIQQTSISSGNMVKAMSTSSFYCFLCSLHSELSFSRMLYSTPQGKKAPYFPFMKKHVPKNKAETLREDGTALVCTFCYHSVMAQWNKYNDSRTSIDINQRKYNFNDYNCYVCGITTYRRRIRALRVVDFPFLRLHKHKKDVIMLENEEMVAVCLDCYERLRGQFSDGERYGIPVEQRQYNWIKVPPPPEDNSAHLTTPQERLLKVEQASVS